MKKILSLFLSVVLIFSVVSVCASADSGLSYSGVAKVIVDKKCSLDSGSFAISLAVNKNKIASFDGASSEFTYKINSLKNSKGDDYYTDSEAFFAEFTDEAFAGSYMDVDFTIDFVSEEVFGELEYTVTVSGFSAPVEIGGDLSGIIGSITGGSSDLDVKLPTDLTTTGTITSFPAISSLSVLDIAKKNSYTDAEQFDPTGVKLSVSLNNGRSGVVTYGETSAHAFSFVPSAKENLTVYDTEVAMTFFGRILGYTPITVDHKWSCDASGNPAYVNITTNKYTEGNPGYHAIVCEGCGEAHDAKPHTPDEDNWTYNNDETFVNNGTSSTVCTDCGAVLTMDVFGTAGFNTTFADMHFIKVIFEYINVLLRFIGSATE